MSNARTRLAPAFVASCTIALVACGGSDDDPITPPDPTPGVVAVVSRNATQVATVGAAFDYDPSRGGATFVDSAGGGLQYAVTTGGAAGLAASGARITGVPTAPGVFTARIVATDARGRTAADSFAIVVYAEAPTAPVLPATRHAYADASAPLPAHFTGPGPGGPVVGTDNTPGANVVTDAGATLGRVLFHDRVLSINDRVACASCHIQAVGFGDTLRLSVGFEGGTTARHSMGLANARFYRNGRFFWDERAATAEAQVLQPIQDMTEMGMTLPKLVTKVAATPYYPPLFRAAFGSDEVTSDRIARALAQYVRSIVSAGSRFDSAFPAAGGPPDFARVFTAQELEGLQLFNGPAGCALCHATNAQVGVAPQNNGLDAVITDQGAGSGRFKSPSLRNVALRRHFMHDGRFSSLAQVIEHYDNGVQESLTLDQRLRAPDGAPRRLNLTPAQKAALVAFLGTLTDSTLIRAEKFSSPFVGR